MCSPTIPPTTESRCDDRQWDCTRCGERSGSQLTKKADFRLFPLPASGAAVSGITEPDALRMLRGTEKRA
jgi:hypothetical protein